MRLRKQEQLVAEFIDQHNPLYLEGEGELQYFCSETGCYVSWLRYLQTHYPSGFIEVVYYVSTYYGYSIAEVRSLLKNPNIKTKEVWVVYVNWRDLDPLSVTALKTLVQRLHKILGTTFREHDFNEAITEFNETYT